VLGGLSGDPDARDCTPPWVTPVSGAPTSARSTTRTPAEHRQRLPFVGPARLGAATVRTLREMAGDTCSTLPFEAPRSIFNVGIGGDRKAVPHLQRMLIHLENAVADLEKATAK